MSDANFNLLGNAVDLGVYKYYLQQDGDDWKLVGTGAVDPALVPVIPIPALVLAPSIRRETCPRAPRP